MSFNNKPTLTFVFLTFLFFGHSQEFSISGKVVDVDSQPVSYANIVLSLTEGGSFVKGTSTNDDGSFKIESISEGSYTLNITFIGYKTITQELNVTSNTELKPFILLEDSETLGEVNIIAKKPSLTRKPDRLIFNVANTALIEGSTLQVLKNTPGVIVTDGSINIKSAPAAVYINERKVQLTTDEVIQLLESAPANSIQSVEVITNPHASYDADSGSVINIIMSKNLVTGYRGSIFGNYTQGVFPRYNGGTSHFFKNNKINLNLNYSYTNEKINRKNDERINYLNPDLTTDEFWDSDINRVTRSEIHNLNLNFDYFISDKSTLSLTSTGLYLPFFRYAINNNTRIFDANGDFDSRFTADNLSRDDKYNIGSDINFRHQINDKSSFSVGGHYTTYNYERDQSVLSNFFDDNNDFVNDSEFRTDADQDTEIINGKIDYNMNPSETSSFDVGLKYSNVTTQSSIFRYNTINGSESLDTANSNLFDYDEKVYAGYLNYSKSWEKVELGLGLRAEQTNVEGVSVTLNETNTQDYLEWFPNASLSFQVAENLDLYGNYKRSITRPDYATLNPFTFFLNENTVIVGNPNLQPTFTDHFIFGTNFLKHFAFEFYYINYDGAINEIPRQDNDTNIIAYTPVNLDKVVDYGFDLQFYYGTNRWNIFALNSVYNMTEEVDFGSDSVELSQWSNLSILSGGLSLLEDNSLNINLSLLYATKYLQGLAFIDDLFQSDLAISKSLWNKKAVISLSATDLFNMQDKSISINYLNQSNSRLNNVDNRTVKLGFRYNFGNTKLNTNERTTDVEERNRLQGQSN
ncbi:TonB-dependent receptor domain-containing protein [Winogradskyella sp. A3E31]|uniref:TonB-dependent receptor domain-containing protein n=1 Tax=Winogradskyella sp. A3E31 TaxID=3349637 RepID=UPI00398ADE89